MPATPTSSIRSTPAPNARATNAASAATGRVRRPGGDHAHRAARLGERADGGCPGDLVDDGAGELGAHGCDCLRRQPGRHGRPLAGLAGELTQDGDRLVDGLAACVHDLGVAGPQAAVGVDPGEAEVDGAVHRAGGQLVELPTSTATPPDATARSSDSTSARSMSRRLCR